MNQPSTVTQFRWDNSYAERLPGFYVSCTPSVVPNPVLLRFNSPLAEELGLNAGKLDSSLAARIFSGNESPAGAQPLAQAYAGHQFGGFVSQLADAAEGNPALLEGLFPSADAVRPWLERWRRRLAQQPTSATPEGMRAVNPIYIPRNHLVEEALAAAFDHTDLTLFERLLDVIAHPYDERPGLEDYAQPAPREFTACFKTFCGT